MTKSFRQKKLARTAPGPSLDTQRRLLLTALQMFAEGGVSGVSTRAIQAAAGCQNASAVQYHFGTKMGLVESVIDLIGERLTKAVGALPQPEAAPQDPRELIRVLLQPFIDLYFDPEIGRDAVKFLSRLQLETDPALRPIFRRYIGAHATSVEETVHKAFPDMDPETLRLRLLFTFALVVHGFATMERLGDSALGEMEPPNKDRLLSEFVNYIAGAWEGP